LEILDDATRLNTGARLYPSETLLAHFDFLSRTFQTHGLPLSLYVDYHSFFYTHNPDAFTQLGAALHFYGVKLLYAPTPQAKGKIERRHDYWQKRLVPLLAADHIIEISGSNLLLDQLVPHANHHEIHRELRITPHAAFQQALAEKRSVIRLAPQCPWWPYVWSQQTCVRVGDAGKVPVGSQRLTQAKNSSPSIAMGLVGLAAARRQSSWSSDNVRAARNNPAAGRSDCAPAAGSFACEPAFIQEHQSLGGHARQPLMPLLSLFHHVGSRLLGGVQRFFYNSSPTSEAIDPWWRWGV
jgi:hypothetical protein